MIPISHYVHILNNQNSSCFCQVLHENPETLQPKKAVLVMGVSSTKSTEEQTQLQSILEQNQDHLLLEEVEEEEEEGKEEDQEEEIL